MTPPPLSLPASSADSIPSGLPAHSTPYRSHKTRSPVIPDTSSASTPPGPLERRRSVPSCAQLPRPLRPPYTPARPNPSTAPARVQTHPSAEARRILPNESSGTLCVRAAAVASSRALSASPGAAASARATALCVVPGRTTALQRVARSRKRGAPSPSPSAIGPDSHGALRGERSRASRAVRIAPVRVLRRIAPSRVVTRRSPVSFESSSIGGRRVDRDGNGEWNGV
ncbi:hypothetical protein C8R43DRAFT_1205418 [Mycena crocata]|nr:hypothetical protein C8R43DRAFT_1205418 [Mycena crocata]